MIIIQTAVNFINVKRAHFSYEFLAPSYVTAWRQKFVQKTCAKNVDEIDTWKFRIADSYLLPWDIKDWQKRTKVFVLKKAKKKKKRESHQLFRFVRLIRTRWTFPSLMQTPKITKDFSDGIRQIMNEDLLRFDFNLGNN